MYVKRRPDVLKIIPTCLVIIYIKAATLVGAVQLVQLTSESGECIGSPFTVNLQRVGVLVCACECAAGGSERCSASDFRS